MVHFESVKEGKIKLSVVRHPYNSKTPEMEAEDQKFKVGLCYMAS